MRALWETQDFRRIAGNTWRPGGVELTRRAVGWCVENGLLAYGGLVVDFGCGAGASLNLLADLGYRVLGLDKNIEYERQDAKSANPMDKETGVRQAQPLRAVIQADVSRPPLAAQSVDGVLCECVLSLFEKPNIVLRAAYEVLRPGGVLVVSDLTLRAEHESVDSMGIRGTSCLAGARSAACWNNLMEQAGFVPLHYEDNSRALAELAARMLWYGGDTAASALTGFESGSSSCSCSGSGSRPRHYGYGLWINWKEIA